MDSYVGRKEKQHSVKTILVCLLLGDIYFEKYNQENIIGNIRTSARNAW